MMCEDCGKRIGFDCVCDEADGSDPDDDKRGATRPECGGLHRFDGEPVSEAGFSTDDKDGSEP